MIKAKFICVLENLAIEKDFKGEEVPFEIEIIPHSENSDYPRLVVTNKDGFIKSFLSNKTVELLMGMHAVKELWKPNIIIAYSDCEFSKDTSPTEYIKYPMQLLQRFINNLWYVKDNFVNFETAYMIHKNSTNNDELTTNGFFNANIGCSTEARGAKFNIEELKAAAKKVNENKKIEKQKDKINYAPLTIADYFIQNTRFNSELGVKIANYCSALEALFSGKSRGEITYKLSERVALLISEDLKIRLDYLKKMKKLYEIRSNVVHGSEIIEEKKINDLIEIDEMCRKIMNKILENSELYELLSKETSDNNQFQNRKKDIDTYFEELVMK